MGRSGRLTLAALATLLPVAAQEAPQMTWEGLVDGTSVLTIRGNRVEVAEREGLPVQRQHYRFFERLPDSRQEVRLVVHDGRGAVRILQQPRLENDYTLLVSIQDMQPGSSFYSLEFYWDTSRGAFSHAPDPHPSFDGGNRLVWTGRVEEEALIECHGRDCITTAVHGTVTRDHYRFTRPLPRARVIVMLDDVQGRGEVRLIQQPREENGFTAKVRIVDTESGPGEYTFSLAWTPLPGAEAPQPAPAHLGMLWYGRVDGRVRVTVRGRRATSTIVEGAPVDQEKADFVRELPAVASRAVTLRLLHGRGRARIVEYPSARNGFGLVFEVEDMSEGMDDYQVELNW